MTLVSLICGLGNPGAEYAGTRHNAGFAVVDRFVGNWTPRPEERVGFSGVFWRGRRRGRTLTALKPMTFMNDSGESVSALMRRHQLVPEELLLIYDDIDLPLGRIRIKRGGGSGGHKGVESVTATLSSSELVRLRVGVGRSPGKTAKDHVLEPFAPEERLIFEDVLSAAVLACETILHRGVTEAMNQFNGVNVDKAKQSLNGG